VPAFASQPDDTFAVSVVAGGAFTSPSLAIVNPAGALDSTVSVGQHLFLRAGVQATASTINLVATLTVPAGYQIVGQPTRNLPRGTGSPATFTPDFDVIAPARVPNSPPRRV
jgi:hypothetical protein